MTILDQVSSDATLYKAAIATLAGVIVALSSVIVFLFFSLQREQDEFRKSQQARLLSAEDHEKTLEVLRNIISQQQRRGKVP